MNASRPSAGFPDPEALLALSRDLLGVVGFDGLIQKVNPAWERTLGFTLCELRRHPLLDLLYPDDLESARAAFAQVARGEGSATSLTNRCRCWDGSYRWLSWRVAASVEKRLYYVVASDVTQLRASDPERGSEGPTAGPGTPSGRPGP